MERQLKTMFYRQRQHTQLVPVKTLAFSNVRIVALATPIVTIRIAAVLFEC
jgi:hypothetical protein